MPATQTIKFICEHCEKQVRIASVHAGRRGKCPKCREAIRVPGKKRAKIKAPKKKRKPSEDDYPILGPDRDEKECPSCGEFVLAKAKKCRECGEWFEKKRRRAARAPIPKKRSSGGAAAGGVFGIVFIIFIVIRVLAAIARSSGSGY